jgi:hypothetical protein
MAKSDLQGALDLLILKTLSQLGSMQGHGIVIHIRRVSDELLIVERLTPSRIAPHGAEQLRARKLGNHRLRAESQVLRSHARQARAIGQPARELGACSQRRRRDSAICMR